MTTAEYFRTPETVLPRELAYGVLRVADAPIVPHQRVVANLFLKLAAHVGERQLGEVLVAPVDVVLDADTALVVQPDLLFVSAERRAIVSDRVNGAPDLVVEVLSPYPRIGRVEEKVSWYRRYGVRECWLASVLRKEIVILSFGAGELASRMLFTGAASIDSPLLGSLPLSAENAFPKADY